jgi:sugar-specific transcriptional regulator TrmB
MIEMKDLIEKLKYLDIPRREGEVYLALLHKKEFTAGEISKVTSVSRTKTYEILQNLVKKGLCTENFRNGVKIFSSIDPEIAIKNILQDYEEKKKVADQLKINLNEIFKANGKIDDPLDYIEVITDLDQIKNRWIDIQQNSIKSELLGFNKKPFSIMVDEGAKYLEAIIKKNVVSKSIFEYSDSEDKASRDILINNLDVLTSIGEEVRVVEKLPMKLVIIDERITMLALNDPISMKPSITTMIITHPSFAISLKTVFESYWDASMSAEDFKKMYK